MTLLEKPYAAPKWFGVYSDGEPAKLSQVKGQWCVLYFYPKDMTPGCTVEAQDFQKQLSKFSKLDCAVVGVSKDSCERHVKFAEKEKIKFALISDESGEMCEAYGVWKEKMNYGKRFMGIERSTFLISPTGRVVAEWRKVKVAGHVDEVLAAVKSCHA